MFQIKTLRSFNRIKLSPCEMYCSLDITLPGLEIYLINAIDFYLRCMCCFDNILYTAYSTKMAREKEREIFEISDLQW